MQYSKRQVFLDSFLKLLGANYIAWTNFEVDKVYGTIIYDLKDPEERQDFCWNITEENVPTNEVLKLINLIKDLGLINGDKIAIPLNELFQRINGTSFDEFISTVEDLKSVKVCMLDKGVETDTFFVHT